MTKKEKATSNSEIFTRNPKLREKLFRLATQPRKILENPEIVLPDSTGTIAKETLFRHESKHRRVLELGSGWGEFLSEWLSNNPEDDYISFELKATRINKTLRSIRKLKLNLHLKIIPINFNYFLESIMPLHSFDIIIINFPDPWPKKRHWKHRLVQKNFPERISQIMRNNSLLYLNTDYGPYARKILKIFRNSSSFVPEYPWPHYLRTHPDNFPYTYFEKMHLKAGLAPYYQSWRKSVNPSY